MSPQEFSSAFMPKALCPRRHMGAMLLSVSLSIGVVVMIQLPIIGTGWE